MKFPPTEWGKIFANLYIIYIFYVLYIYIMLPIVWLILEYIKN